MQVSEDRFNFIKFKINKNKNLATTIDKDGVKTRYSLNDANELVNKIAMKKKKKKNGKNSAIKKYNSLVDRVE